MFRRKTVIFTTLFVVLTFFLVLKYLTSDLPSPDKLPLTTNLAIQEAIYKNIQNIVPKQTVRVNDNVEKFLQNLKYVNKTTNSCSSTIWKLSSKAGVLTDLSSPILGNILHCLKYSEITRADVDSRGTQLKLLLTLAGSQQVVFKPKWYDEAKSINGAVYAGKDRYQSEIVAFYLSVLFNMPQTPISVKRTISLKHDIMPVAMPKLNQTIYRKNTTVCLFGKCYYCKITDPICDDAYNQLIGAVILNIPIKFNNYRSPWQRTYKTGNLAQWEIDINYCKRIKLPKKRLLDLTDTSIFDYLLQNGDRHHYETYNDSVVWIDNGKGLGNSHVHHHDILAPLYQCCQFRSSTVKTLEQLAGGNLRKYLKRMPDIDQLLTEPHLQAMEFRLLYVFSAIEFCKNKRKFT